MSNYGGNIMRVGFYECDVTPPLGCGIPGYSNFHSGQDVVDRLYVKAIVVESQETISAIVAIDACVMDNDIYDFVVEWKPRWKSVKSDEICDTIFNMYSLGWISVSHSGKINYAHDF